jgi:hypothetical protein
MFVAAGWVAAAPPAKKPAALVSTSTVHVSSDSLPLPFVLKPIKNDAFWAGETLEFAIKYEFVTAGTAVMSVRDSGPVEGHPTFQIVTKAESNSMVDKFFKVRDFNSAIVDRASLLSRNFHQNLKEGKYAVIRNTTFDYNHGKYTFERLRKGKTTKREGKLKSPVMDVLGAFFYARTLPLRLGEEIRVTVFSDEELYPLRIKVGSKLETIKVSAGKFECIKIQPLVNGDAIFKASDGKMEIWLTNDRYKMPVLIRSKVFVGSFDAELQSFERPPKPAF